MATVPPPPTYADVVLTDERTKKSVFNPIWLNWFLEIAQTLSQSGGGGGGGIQHNSLAGLQGGISAERYHTTAAQNAAINSLPSTFVSGFNTRTGAVVMTSGDVTTALGFTPYNSTNPSGYISGNQTITFTGDATGSGTTAIALTLPAVNSNVGTFGDAAHVGQFTVNAKGLITAASSVPITSGGTGTVTSVSVVTANGVSGSVATPTSTPVITLMLGAITPTTINPTGAITPVTTAGIVGTTLADNANAGSVGEYVSSTVHTVGLTSNVTENLTSISLTAGDWDVEGTAVSNPAAGTTIIYQVAGVNTVSATLPNEPMKGIIRPNSQVQNSASVTAIKTRINVSATTTVYLTTNFLFSGGTCTADGIIQARRVR